MTATVMQGDARNLPLPDASVDLIVTSPPYWALRSYTDAGEHYQGQIGAEATPAEYIDSLIDCTREWMRVLKPSGSLWVNLGDKYSTYEARNPSNRTKPEDAFRVERSQERARYVRSAPEVYGVPYKSLMGLPWRYAIRCIDDLGLILRAEVIWSKPNPIPSSATDRVRRSHEQWFHLVRSPKYFAAVDTIRGAHLNTGGGRGDYDTKAGAAARAAGTGRQSSLALATGNSLGKLPGSVWTVATQPLTVPAELGVDHFAAFPMAWPRRIVLGWSPSGICTACGEGRRPVTSRCLTNNRGGRQTQTGSHTAITGGTARQTLGWERDYSITGEACACPDTSAPTRPAVVVDPFGGTGTTALVAHAYGRHGVSVDMSSDYCRLAAWRTSDPGQLAAAFEVEKPAVQHVGQMDLFDGVAS